MQAGAHPNNPNPMAGGALIRILRRVSDDKVISGPSLLVDELLRASDAEVGGIDDLVEKKWGGDISAFAEDRHGTWMSLQLRSKKTVGGESMAAKGKLTFMFPPPASATRVFRSPRIGLELSQRSTTASPSHPRVIFVSRAYRYFIQPTLLTANGRPQTFLGILRSLSEGKDKHEITGKGTGKNKASPDVALVKNVTRLSGIKEDTVKRYLADFREGKATGELDAFVGTRGKGASSSPGTYLRMMGTLGRIQA
jgi:hypothetical protein